MIPLSENYSFSPELQLKTNTLVCGNTGVGKTKLSYAICDILIKSGWEVVVFDSVGVWKRSGLRHIQRIREGQVNVLTVVPPSIVYDISSLKIDSQKELVDQFCEFIFGDRLDDNWTKPLLIVFEEAQIYLKNLKSDVAQNVFRLMFAGRNLGIRCLIITPRINNCPTEILFLTGQIYIGQQNESNVQRKLRSMYGKAISETVKHLEVGEFIYVNPKLKTPHWIRVPEFIPDFNPVLRVQQIETTEKDFTKYEKIGKLVGILLGLVFGIIILSIF